MKDYHILEGLSYSRMSYQTNYLGLVELCQIAVNLGHCIDKVTRYKEHGTMAIVVFSLLACVPGYKFDNVVGR